MIKDKETIRLITGLIDGTIDKESVLVNTVTGAQLNFDNGRYMLSDFLKGDFTLSIKKTKTIIPQAVWDGLNKELNYFAVDGDGETFFYELPPISNGEFWSSTNGIAYHVDIDMLNGVILGTCDSKDSLVRRPE